MIGPKPKGRLSLWSLVMLIFVPTFGFNNITTNGVALGPAAVPSWILVCLLYFLPLTAIIAELASANKHKGGGIYSWIAGSLGDGWAFFGTWSYFIANLFYLQYVFARIPVMVSWAVFGENRFNDQNVALLPYYSVILCLALTWIATRGVKQFSKLSDLGGKFTFISTGLFILLAFAAYLGGTPSATEWTAETVIPDFSTSYFATFSWLLFAVAGAEVAGTYIDKVDQPVRTFPRGVLIATMLVGVAYIIGSMAVSLVASPQVLTEAGLKDANYVVHIILAETLGLSGKLVVQIYAAILVVTSIAAYVVWIESPIRAMFADVPERTFPKFLTSRDENDSFSNALWTQSGVVIILIIIPLLGLASIDGFFRLLTDLSSLSLVIPYIILAAAFLAFRLKGGPGPFTMLKSNQLAISVAVLTVIISVAGFFGAGLDYFVGAETSTEATQAILMTYGGPLVLIALGYALTYFTKKFAK
ncbi:MAG: amino acid permease [Candidatus Marinimicrobia bacterium]|nr:amino acid permease [Candidatus Neomarinimicrobiota bacterium]